MIVTFTEKEIKDGEDLWVVERGIIYFSLEHKKFHMLLQRLARSLSSSFLLTGNIVLKY